MILELVNFETILLFDLDLIFDVLGFVSVLLFGIPALFAQKMRYFRVCRQPAEPGPDIFFAVTHFLNAL